MSRMQVLVSVRSVDEALAAAAEGVDFIDLKEPGRGALGGLPLETIRAIVVALASRGGAKLSATIGDIPLADAARIAERVDAVGACGVDYVKVGIERVPQASAVLSQLARCGWPVVPVFIADQGFDDRVVAAACRLRFAALMADTADKRAGSLFDALPIAALRRFVATVRRARLPVGLAGALREGDLPRLRALAPDFAGFRSAVCAGDRASALDPQRVRTLIASLRAHGGRADVPVAPSGA